MAFKILVVDDDNVVVEVIKKALVKRNYEVQTAGSGKEALDRVKYNSPDLILLDVIMPEMNGYEFLVALKALRSIQAKEMIPVMVITAKGEMEDLFKYEGVKEYFVKPLELTLLIKKIEECLGPNA